MAGSLSIDRSARVISGVVLAAGTSSRLGRPKQLLELGGKPVLQHAIDAALAAPLDEVVVVLGHLAEAVRAAVAADERVRFVVNPDYGRGQSTSLRAGLRACAPASEAAVVLLGDQPDVSPKTIAAVVESWLRQDAPIVQAAYGGRPAHPTLLARSAWAEIEEGTGDEGARGFIKRHPQLRALVEVGGTPPNDIDTEEDYVRAVSRQRSIGPA